MRVFLFSPENFIKKDINVFLYHGHTKYNQFSSAHEMTKLGLLLYQ